MNFSRKVFIITGASSGIGAATATYLAECNANVVIVGRNLENLKKTADACEKVNSKISCLQIQADVTVDSQKIIDETIEKFGRIDTLVNNAGILESGSILTSDVEQFDSIMATNLRSVFILTKLATPYLIKLKGNIVNVSSVAGLRSFPNALNYCISKAALDQFTKCTALDLAPMNVRVNSVNPGVIVTDIHKRSGMDDQTYKEYLERSKETHAMGRVGQPLEVATAIAFLASDMASFTTGACLPIDGGKHLMCPR